MKRNRTSAPAALLAALLLLSVLTGCGAQSAADTAPSEAAGTTDFALSTATTAGAAAAGENTAGESDAKTSGRETKRIRSAQLELQTTAFDDAEKSLNALAESLGGYLESSDVSGGGDGLRTGSYAFRVPAGRFPDFLARAGTGCSVVSRSSSVEDVTQDYYDTAGRLKTQQTKLERLQALLARADKMEDIITLESAISDTEEQIDTLSGQVRYYDGQVADASVTVSLTEVYRLPGAEQPASGFAQRLSAAFASGWNGAVTLLQSAAVALAYLWLPVIVVIAAVIAVRAARKKRRRAPSAPDAQKKS